MVKVFLEKSAESCMERLNALMHEDSNYRIICPNAFFLKRLTIFYPNLTQKNLRTLSQLWCELGHTPIPKELTNLFAPINPFRDTTLQLIDGLKTLTKTENEMVNKWLTSEGFRTWEEISITNIFCKNCIFFGPFSSALLNELCRYLKPFFEHFFAVKRMLKSTHLMPLKRTKGHKVYNIQQERECVRKLSKEDTDFIACHPENWVELFQINNDFLRFCWINCQEERTLGYFLPYIYATIEDKDRREACIKKLQKAQRACCCEDLLVLKEWLSQNEIETIPFIDLDWPFEKPLGDFVHRLNTFPYETSSHVTWTLPKFLETCPIKFKRRQFFAYLRNNIKHYQLEHLIPWEEALYLPIKKGCFLHGVSEQPTSDIQILSWLSEVENREGNLIVLVPERDEKGMPYRPLIPAVEQPEGFAQKINKFSNSPDFILPIDYLKFSCKNWERFRLSPIKTWLDTLLKVKKFDLISANARARICGEWVHENLEFETQPQTLFDWQRMISDKAASRWQILKNAFEQNMATRFQQWHIWTLHLSLKIAQACSDLIGNDWQLQSEYVLPKNAENAGRIDLLATRSKEAIIVDYKTAIDYTFTVGKLNKGYGLQLLLYGKALETHYENIQLRAVNGNGEIFTMNLCEIEPKITIITDWLQKIKQTAIYINPPEEQPNTLPLCWHKK
jgi:hypothetical protein